MFLVDDILLAPFHSLLWIFDEIHQAAQQEMAEEADALTAQLSDLYLMLENGRLSEEEFDVQEKRLLDRLDQIRPRKGRYEHKDQA